MTSFDPQDMKILLSFNSYNDPLRKVHIMGEDNAVQSLTFPKSLPWDVNMCFTTP